MSRAVVDAKEFSHAMSKVSKILKKCAIPILEVERNRNKKRR